MNINAIYPAFDGEVNAFGIGCTTIFVRTQGCHLRCYKNTKGILCDTPEALELHTSNRETWMTVGAIMGDLNNIRSTSGISKVTLSGGDPLARPSDELHELFMALEQEKFLCTVETSGTLSIEPYRKYKDVHWVLDYKLSSCGIEESIVNRTLLNIPLLDSNDYLKFVVERWSDYDEFRKIYEKITSMKKVSFNIAVGLFWGSAISNFDLFNCLVRDCLAKHVCMNFQVHKLALNPDFKVEVPKMI